MKSPVERAKPKKFIPKVGRPTDFSEKIINEICFAISESKIGIRKLCAANPHWPAASTIMQWRIINQQFSERYDAARKCQVELYVDDAIDIAFDESRDIITAPDGKDTGNSTAVSRDKLKVETIKWRASTVSPKMYGEAKKEIIYEKQNLVNMDLEDRINQIESLTLEEQRELFGVVAKKIKEAKGNK